MMFNDKTCLFLNASQYILTVAQLEATLRVVSLIFSIVTSMIILVNYIIKWYKSAKEDGVITKDEIKDGIEDVKPMVEDLIDKIEQVSQEIEKEDK